VSNYSFMRPLLGLRTNVVFQDMYILSLLSLPWKRKNPALVPVLVIMNRESLDELVHL
jgi:hypothetical protein